LFCLLNKTFQKKELQNISDHLSIEVFKLLSRDITSFKSEECLYILLSFSALTKTNFLSVDKEFKNFGTNVLDMIRNYDKYATEDEIELILDSFSDLVLSNLGFSNSELFPEIDISDITSKLQVYLLMNKKSFRLLPQVLKKCSDVQFNFE
jgi:hypothetical protein